MRGPICCVLVLVGAFAPPAPLAAAVEPFEPQLLAAPEDFLAARGYPASRFDVESAWVEQLPGADADYAYGFLLQPVNNGKQFDVYFHARTGEPCAAPAPKRWAGTPRVKAAEQDARVHLPPAATVVMPFDVLPEPLAEEYVLLPALDVDALLLEDAETEKGRLRMGTALPLDAPVALATLRAPDKSGEGIALRAFTAPGALGLRLEVRHENLPTGARIWAYAPATPEEIFELPLTEEQGAFWTPTCYGDTTVLLLHVPGRAAVMPGSIEVSRVVQVYRIPGWTPEKRAGSCNLDFACYGEWASIGRGVTGLGFVSYPDFLFCTGSLLADADPTTAIPYFLTANHCVSRVSEARSLEFYWRYEASICGGAPPRVTDVTRTVGGADFLAGNENRQGTDFTLLRLTNPPPAGVTWLGWETLPPNPAAHITCIHHPDGDYKRISFGQITQRASPLRPASRYHQVVWASGVTEPGSSGSPLFISATQRIIGQLYGGSSSCSLPREPDYYGRFDKSYPLMERYLGAINDPYDVNSDGRVNAADIQAVVNAALKQPRLPNADLDVSGAVDAVDIQLVIIAVLAFSG